MKVHACIHVGLQGSKKHFMAFNVTGVAFCAQWAVMNRPAHVTQMALVTFSMQRYLKHGEHHPLHG